jgi:hypothetical protein
MQAQGNTVAITLPRALYSSTCLLQINDGR